MATEIVYMVVYQHYSISKNIIKLNVCCSVPCYNNQVTGISNTAGIMLTKYLGRFAPQLARFFLKKKFGKFSHCYVMPIKPTKDMQIILI